MRQKKGISPLIATVLILGFTVALAAVIMVWGQRFTVGIQKQTEETANTQLNCASDVDLRFLTVCNVRTTQFNDTYSVSIVNDGSAAITKVVIRSVNATGGVVSNDTAFIGATGIAAYGTSTQLMGGISEATYMEAVPTAIINGKEVGCSASRRDIGDEKGLPFGTC